MTSIFGNSSSTTGGSRHLVEFKAGRMNMVSYCEIFKFFMDLIGFLLD